MTYNAFSETLNLFSQRRLRPIKLCPLLQSHGQNFGLKALTSLICGAGRCFLAVNVSHWYLMFRHKCMQVSYHTAQDAYHIISGSHLVEFRLFVLGLLARAACVGAPRDNALGVHFRCTLNGDARGML